jgi:hypothetical protein
MKTGIVNRLCASAHKRALMVDHAVSASINTRRGVSPYAHTPELIVSLTTIPERVGGIHVVIDSLLRQSLKPDRVILWLNECDEPGRPKLTHGTLPENLTRLERRGLTIEWCRNIGPYCKLIPALRMFPNALIATADDDVYYCHDWLRGLYETYTADPRSIPCHRAHLMRRAPSGGFLPYREWEYFAPGVTGPEPLLFPTGVGGVLYAPGHLHPDVTNESIFLKLCPKADDVWLKAMAVANGTLSRKVSALSPRLFSVRYRRDRRLMQDNVCGDGNDRQIRAVAQYCPALATLAGIRMHTLSWEAVATKRTAVISA